MILQYNGLDLIFMVVSTIIQIPFLIWLYRDAESRGMDGTKWLFIGLCFGCVGCIVYLFVRDDNPPQSPSSNTSDGNQLTHFPSDTSITHVPPSSGTTFKCPNCNNLVYYNQDFCQHCGKQLR